ncbi:hypothetical protein COL26b_011709 [Colletotrichum chrysophilum]|uniref:uncharacterized protein n=1 Tax=Colletotrichum chrysophilum TaxID=1836956 RepID=UPI0023005A88|nr:uncharacterized protein COL26b_011709 [Colletotrichum chrysophilum]KAJ0366413.1 hypothetical protein COL26b_011709 [Colletotrichum chrysophilum]
MASITDLPRELIGAIVAEVSTLQDLDNLMRASRYFLQAVHAWPAIPHIVLRRQLLMELPSGLMACAIGIVEAGNLPRPRSSKHAGRAMSRVLYQVAHDPGHSLNLVSTLCFKSLIKIRDMHKTILSLANAMAQDAWKMLRDVDGVVSGDLVLSGREQHRITKAIYETELLSTVFGDESWETADLDVFYSADGDIYLATKSSWEIEAIGCVLDFFEKRLFEVALDVFTHDVEFGWSSFDYDNTAARLLAMEASWDERAAIYEEGGRGFLKDGDYNGIEWTGEKMKNSHGEQDETSDEDSDDDE